MARQDERIELMSNTAFQIMTNLNPFSNPAGQT